MVILELNFPAGRFHATPWGRNVNEGEPEWPPSPYRLIRTLIDVQKRRFPEWNNERLARCVNAVSGKPFYYLPVATGAHIKSYMSSNQKDRSDKKLIFDPFIALAPDATVDMGFDVDLSGDVVDDLARLLEEINFFGRAESLATIRLSVSTGRTSWNCVPVEHTAAFDNPSTKRVACALTQKEYSNSTENKKLSWLEALNLSTNDLLKAGWSQLFWFSVNWRIQPFELEFKNGGIHHEKSEKKLHPQRKGCAPEASSGRSCASFRPVRSTRLAAQRLLPLAEGVL